MFCEVYDTDMHQHTMVIYTQFKLYEVPFIANDVMTDDGTIHEHLGN